MPGRHVPVKRSRAAVGFLDAISVSVIGVGVTSRARDAIFLIVAERDTTVGGVGGHVAGRVIAVAGELVVYQCRGTEVLCAAFSNGFVGEIAPGVIAVAVAPVFGLVQIRVLAVQSRAGVLGGGEAVQRIVGKRLVAGVVFVIGDAPDIAVVGAGWFRCRRGSHSRWKTRSGWAPRPTC